MKQVIATFLLYGSLCFSCYSQGFYGELEGGSNSPLGAFKSASRVSGGSVYSGVQIGGALGYRFNKTWAIGFRSIHTINTLDYGQAFFVRKPPWQSTSFLLSAKLTRPINEHLFAELEGQAGNMWLIFPGSFSSIYDQKRAGGFVSGIRVGLKYHFNEKVAFKLSVNYLGADIDNSRDQQTLSQNVSLALFNMGIIFEWKAKDERVKIGQNHTR